MAWGINIGTSSDTKCSAWAQGVSSWQGQGLWAPVLLAVLALGRGRWVHGSPDACSSLGTAFAWVFLSHMWDVNSRLMPLFKLLSLTWKDVWPQPSHKAHFQTGPLAYMNSPFSLLLDLGNLLQLCVCESDLFSMKGCNREGQKNRA